MARSVELDAGELGTGREGGAVYRQGDILIVSVAQEALPAHGAHAPREPRDARGRLVLALAR